MPIHDSPEKCEIGDGVLLTSLLHPSISEETAAVFLESNEEKVVFRSPFDGSVRTFRFEEYPTESDSEYGWTRVA